MTIIGDDMLPDRVLPSTSTPDVDFRLAAAFSEQSAAREPADEDGQGED